MIIDSLANIDFYKALNDDIYQGLLFIKKASPDIALGVYPLTPTAKAVVMEYETKEKNDFGYEAHRHGIDVQCCIIGTERIPWSNVKRLKPHSEYNPENDATFYEMIKPQGEAIIGNEIFAVFYPGDAHAPVYSDGEPAYMKKIVIKVRL